ncbi:MAG: helix-turn-helix domain-containing protein [Kluyvera sp.]|uniref:helix-turn-helix domain-containing protein n=1 Tax=Kluyvera sp. TaxID=1538228 RepID=UPI003A8B6CC8
MSNFDHRAAFIERLCVLKGSDNLSKFAARCSMSEGGMRKYLTGQSSPSLDKLIQISRAMGISISSLIGESEMQAPSVERHPYEKISDCYGTHFLFLALDSLSIDERQALERKVVKHGAMWLLESVAREDK